MVFLMQTPPPGFGLRDLFGDIPAFKTAWASYHKKDELAVDYSAFTPGLFPGSGEDHVIYDVYFRK